MTQPSLRNCESTFTEELLTECKNERMKLTACGAAVSNGSTVKQLNFIIIKEIRVSCLKLGADTPIARSFGDKSVPLWGLGDRAVILGTVPEVWGQLAPMLAIQLTPS